MALLIQPTKITKKMIEQIQSYEPYIECGRDAGCDQIEELMYNLLPLFKTCSVKKQKQVVDKIIGDDEGGTWYANRIAEYICFYAFQHNDIDPRLVKYVYKKYMRQIPSCPQTFKKFILSSIDCPCSSHKQLIDKYLNNIPITGTFVCGDD